MYYRARWYDPQVGRFVSEDPIGFGGGLNLYAYVGNGPLMDRDPLGLERDDAMIRQYINGLDPRCQEICKGSCSSVPYHNPNWNVNDNIRISQKSINPFWFYNQVKAGGPWDYKETTNRYIDGRREFEHFGNFNYGATCKAWGFSEFICLNEAGIAQQKGDGASYGRGETSPRLNYFSYLHLTDARAEDWGDDPLDKQQIIEGFDYYDKWREREKCSCAP
jgi:hypothetical protein